MRVFFGRLGIFPMPSIRKPLLFLGSCFFCCTTRGCRGCEKNVNYEPFWFNFLTNTYLSILRAYTHGREGRKEKQQGERGATDILKGILKIKWPNPLIIRWEKWGPKKFWIVQNYIARLAESELDHSLWIPSIVLISLEFAASDILRELLQELTSLLQRFWGEWYVT